MFLKEFWFEDSERGEVRRIPFKRGLNLILDTTSKESTDSGNNVGKTTFLRCVDFCLGSEGKNIYEDPEFDTVNEPVLSYLKDKKVTFHLTISDSAGDLHIERQLGEKPRINTFPMAVPDFRLQLSQRLFKLHVARPSLREMMGKFFRLEENQIANTLKFLYNASLDEYDAVHLYLFGFTNQAILAERNALTADAIRLTNEKAALSIVSKKELKEEITKINRDIKAQEERLSSFQVDDAVTNELDSLKDLRKAISDLSLTRARFQMRNRLNSETLSRLKAAEAKIDTETIRQIYDEAKQFIPALQKEFEEVLGFHNAMLKNKATFVEQQLQRGEKQLTDTDRMLKDALRKEQSVLKSVSEKGALADLQKVQKELYQLYEKRGVAEARIKQRDDVVRELTELQSKIAVLEEDILRYRTELDKKLERFNVIFSDYSSRLYGVGYKVTYKVTKGKNGHNFRFGIENAVGNAGSGMKKARAASFDLAYLKFLEVEQARIARFTAHDMLEDVYENQLGTLFSIANEIDGQYIVAILRDKLHEIDAEYIRKNTILTLSQQDRFFKIA